MQPLTVLYHGWNSKCRNSPWSDFPLHTTNTNAALILFSRTVPAKWVVEPADQSVYVGTHVAIHCQAEGFPKPAIRWKQAVGKCAAM